MAKSKNHSKLTKNGQKTVKMSKNSKKKTPLRNDPLQVLAMGVDVGAKNRSKEGLIFTLEFSNLKNDENELKIMFSSKSTKTQKVTKIKKSRKCKK